MTIFNFINDILQYKKGDLLDNIDNESQYNSYMINRWISMYSPQLATVVNLTTNIYGSIFETKNEHYRFMCSVIPRVKIYRINYIKKTPKKEDDEANVISVIANSLELSEREINYYIKTNNIDIERLKLACH